MAGWNDDRPCDHDPDVWMASICVACLNDRSAYFGQLEVSLRSQLAEREAELERLKHVEQATRAFVYDRDDAISFEQTPQWIALRVVLELAESARSGEGTDGD